LVTFKAFTELLHGVPNQPGGQQIPIKILLAVIYPSSIGTYGVKS
jgi:hypothetical protein